MPQGISATLLAALVPLLAGIWVTLIGFEVIGKVPGMELNPRYGQRQRVYRVGGPIVIVLSLFLIGYTLAGSYFAAHWRTFAPEDADFTIDLPGAPVETTIEERGRFGPTWNHFAKVAVQGRGISCLVRYTRLPGDFPDLSGEELQELLKEMVAETAKAAKGEVKEESEIAHDAGGGRRFKIQMLEGYVLLGEVFILGRTQFQLQIVAPKDRTDSEIVTRFFDSFSYYGQRKK